MGGIQCNLELDFTTTNQYLKSAVQKQDLLGLNERSRFTIYIGNARVL